MKRILNNIINIESALHYFDADGKEIAKGNLTGDVSGLTGNVSGRLTGNVSGLTGNVDECEITSTERKSGIFVSDLVSK